MTFLIQQTLICTIPLLIVAMAGMFAERSGIINIALDGIMIMGAFCGALAAFFLLRDGSAFNLKFVSIAEAKDYLTVLIESGTVPELEYERMKKRIDFLNWLILNKGNIIFFISMLVASVSGAIFSLLLSFSAINLKADQTIGGTALNLLAPAIALFIIKIFFMQDKLVMPNDTGFVIINNNLPGWLQSIFSRAYISTFIVIILYVILSILLYKTKFGLRLRACGEHPQAADSVGINVHRMRYIGTTISGALGGLGGYIYIATSAGGTASGSVAGMGFLAIAIMIFGNWKPVGIAFGSLLFGLLRCIGSAYASLDINGDGKFLLKDIGLPNYFYNLIPYVAVLIVLMFTSGKSRAPKAEGIPYDKGMR